MHLSNTQLLSGDPTDKVALFDHAAQQKNYFAQNTLHKKAHFLAPREGLSVPIPISKICSYIKKRGKLDVVDCF